MGGGRKGREEEESMAKRVGGLGPLMLAEGGRGLLPVLSEAH